MSAPTVTAKDLVLLRYPDDDMWSLHAPGADLALSSGPPLLSAKRGDTRPDAADYADALRILSGRPRPDWIECWEAEDGTVWLVPEGEDIAIQVGEPESSMMEDCERYRALEGWEPSEYPSQCRALSEVVCPRVVARWSRLEGFTFRGWTAEMRGPTGVYVYAPGPPKREWNRAWRNG